MNEKWKEPKRKLEENDFEEHKLQDLLKEDPKNKARFEWEKQVHKDEGNESKEFMEYWYNKIHELETGKYGLKAKQDVLIDMLDVKYKAAPEEFKEQIEQDLEKNFEYDP